METLLYIDHNLEKPLPRGTIIRSEDYGAYLSAKEILEQAKQQAARIIADAERKAQEKTAIAVADAQKECEALANEARESGMQEGLERAYEARLQAQEYLSGVEHRMVELVSESVARIVGELNPPDLIARIVHQSIRKFQDDAKVVIRVSPRVAGDVQEHLNKLAENTSRSTIFSIVGDHTLNEDDCILESERSLLDASLSAHMKALRTSLDRVIKNKTPKAYTNE